MRQSAARKAYVIFRISASLLCPTLGVLDSLAQVVQKTNQPSLEEHRVDELLHKLTLAEKMNLIGGTGSGIAAVPRLGLPALKMTDGPVGVREGRSTAYMGGIGLAATWDPALAERVGEQIGREAAARGSSFQLAPGVNIYRSPVNGRNFEYFGEDPFLAARIAVGYVRGVQSAGVIATVKHFVANNSEYARNEVDAKIDERTLREIYLPAFEAAVHEGGAGAVMDAYNLVNGEHMTENRHLNVDVLKHEWGFPYLLMSDWGATHSILPAARGGLDLEMPNGEHLRQQTLEPLIRSGQLSIEDIDEKVRRILRTEIHFGLLSSASKTQLGSLLNTAGDQIALQTAREGIVLLKNAHGALPFDPGKLRSIAVIGPESYPTPTGGGGSSQVNPYASRSMLTGIAERVGASMRVYFDRGLPTFARVAQDTKWTLDADGTKPGVLVEDFAAGEMRAVTRSRVSPAINQGKLIDMTGGGTEDAPEPMDGGPKPALPFHRWTGYYHANKSGSYDLMVQQSSDGTETGFRIWCDGAIVADQWRYPRAIVETLPVKLSAGPHKFVFESRSRDVLGPPLFRAGIRLPGSWVTPEALSLASKVDAVVVGVGFDPSTEFEGWDRSFELPPGQDELIREMAARNKQVIVVITGGGNVDMSSWIDRVPAVLMAWYPGQEGGAALAEILSGDTDPSGHLPATFERALADNPTHDSYYPADGTLKVTYREGLFVGYRGYQENSVSPRFPFGFGLSYTDFRYSNLRVEQEQQAAGRYKVTVDVTNTGAKRGTAVPELYIAPPAGKVKRPKEELKGYLRVELEPGAKKAVSFELDPRSFAFYDVAKGSWSAPAGRYEVRLGQSADEIVAKTFIVLGDDLSPR